MKWLLPLALGLICLGLSALVLVRPEFFSWGNPPGASSEKSAGVRLPPTEREKKFEARRLQLLELQVKQKQLCEELADGNLTLPEAVARYRDIYRNDPLFWKLLPRFEQGRTDAERLCWSVVRCPEAYLGDPCAAAAVTYRLRGELEERLRRFGRLDLPLP